jgi:ABC-type branched-subunit amino acid transport system permease subunit
MLEPSITRQLLVGALLVVLMATRPQGIFGKPRVEVL